MQNRPEARAARSERRAAKLRSQRIIFALIILILVALIGYLAYTAIQRATVAPASMQMEAIVAALQAGVTAGIL